MVTLAAAWYFSMTPGVLRVYSSYLSIFCYLSTILNIKIFICFLILHIIRLYKYWRFQNMDLLCKENIILDIFKLTLIYRLLYWFRIRQKYRIFLFLNLSKMSDHHRLLLEALNRKLTINMIIDSLFFFYCQYYFNLLPLSLQIWQLFFP